MSAASTVIAVLGAESTGKSTLATALGESLAAEGVDVAVVPELLRAFCAREGRTPYAEEQCALARAQSTSIQLASTCHSVVVADTTALMTAVYSHQVFGDVSLYPDALLEHARYRLTLLTGLDLPWVADGLQRDGVHARAQVDARLRTVLLANDVAFSVVYGTGADRLQAALAAVRRCLQPVAGSAVAGPRWRWVCRRCGDGGCEAPSPASEG